MRTKMKKKKNIKNIYTFTSCVRHVTYPIVPNYRQTHSHNPHRLTQSGHTMQIHATISAIAFRMHPRKTATMTTTTT